VVGAEKIHHGLHPEKPWFHVIGRGFDSRHLHHEVVVGRGGVLVGCTEGSHRLVRAFSASVVMG